ncbi:MULTISPECIES: hypothetical protein [Galbibacter]|uniref:Uncharacterized protein n=1 Tax=Galbibacter pacificus TaxID=2996052 RepID=A0ABT6FV06_9FLAO|nr:hypothetical protein [Galbibacter pacificus]MDG3583424.1 hypothetical protein [Galbibacter pacificus]MDG3587099.1 hypothetical protein [Galbibacter pacificus]
MNVFVFKTSVNNQKDIKRLQNPLNQLMHQNEQWSFDLEDCDNILRVESLQVKAYNIANTLNILGFSCEEI